MRGQVTEEVKVSARELLDIDITTEQLRLLPYIQYIMMNEKVIDHTKLTITELDIIECWIRRGWISTKGNTISISVEFWNAMNAILWLGYVSPGNSQ